MNSLQIRMLLLLATLFGIMDTVVVMIGTAMGIGNCLKEFLYE